MAASPAEITVSFAGNVRLSLCDWLDRKSRLAQEIVKPAACDWITARVDDCCGLDVVGSRNTPDCGRRDQAYFCCGLDVVGSRNTPDRGVRNRPCVIDRVSFISPYSNEGRGIDNPLGV